MTIRPLRCDEIASLVHLCGEHAAYEKADYASEGKSESLRRAMTNRRVRRYLPLRGSRTIGPVP